MAAKPSIPATALRSQVREVEKAARLLLTRAAYLQKLAQRPRLVSMERHDLNARAGELQGEAERLLGEASDLSRQIGRLTTKSEADASPSSYP